MKKLLSICALLVGVILLPAAVVEIETVEKRDFKVNEEITFKVTVWAEKDVKMSGGTFDIDLLYCGKTKLDRVAVDLSKGNPQTFTTRLDRPGFILASPRPLKTADGQTQQWQTHRNPAKFGGAAIEPEKLTAGGKRPDDFDKFWLEGIEAYKAAKVEVTPAEDIKRKDYKVFRIKVNFADNSGSINGYLSIPEKPGKYPAVAAVPGAGIGQVTPRPMWAAPMPTIELMLNVHNFPTATDRNEQEKRYQQYNKKFKEDRYFMRNVDDRNEYIYRKVWLAVNRAIDYVAALKEFDGKHLAMTGNSQGGGTALAVGSLSKHVSCIVASVPALSDHEGWKSGRTSGWPLLHRQLNGQADAIAPYFDAAFFADNIKVPVLVSVGYIDTTCAPSSVFAAYNRIKSSKNIYKAHRGTHSNEPEFWPMVKDFLQKELTK